MGRFSVVLQASSWHSTLAGHIHSTGFRPLFLAASPGFPPLSPATLLRIDSWLPLWPPSFSGLQNHQMESRFHSFSGITIHQMESRFKIYGSNLIMSDPMSAGLLFSGLNINYSVPYLISISLTARYRQIVIQSLIEWLKLDGSRSFRIKVS